MGFSVGAKHVVLCGVAALLLSYAAFYDKFPHGDGVSVQGRKDLTDSLVAAVLGNDVVSTGGFSVEPKVTTTKAVAEEAVPTELNEEFTQEDSEELPVGKPVRVMEEIAPEPSVGDLLPPVVIPDPVFSSANPFLQLILQNNAESARNERAIGDCMAEEGCGTPP